MCMLFFHFLADPSPDKYRLILANVRDESWDRLTLPLGFWKDNPQCIGGMDLMEGREGGTWLAVNRNGKLSCLLNIYCEEPDPSKKHRGQLVSDYLNNDQYTAVSYSNTLASLRTDFSPFTIVLMDLSSNEAYCLSNTEDNSEPQTLEPGTSYVFGNSELLHPLQKVCKGKELFDDVIAKYSTTQHQQQLKDSLFQMMMNKEPYYDQEYSQKFPSFNSTIPYIYFQCEEERRGSRTHTVLLVDGDGKIDITERTLETPIKAGEFSWQTSSFSYSLAL
ncbi:transport and Golgi organization 2 homolog [Octopus sinensis]|uniref:Transport and Golgi organization 2 homolog n=1 Tax=Octopus sinensis TaxID=2607531 RepID=A0A6P7TNZ3_9MOLL|nr:transport and Golgi organization 2 homolog [Octopus sinensis]XP_036371088.1 transport and Golgi organization 2 homolog [Octopus sinensis]